MFKEVSVVQCSDMKLKFMVQGKADIDMAALVLEKK